jgi:integrase
VCRSREASPPAFAESLVHEQGEVKRVAFHIKPLVGLSGFRRRHRQSRPRLEVVSKPLGHATTTITEHTYAELLDDTTRRELLHILQQSATYNGTTKTT